MKRLAAITLSIGLSFPSSVNAFSVMTIFAATALGNNGATVTLEVASGIGLNVNFIPVGETIKKAWIDDPSEIALSFDGDLCQWTNSSDGTQQSSCSNEGASVVHLRRIKAINFPDLPRSASGSTLLTLVSESASGRKLYQFKVKLISTEPKYTTIAIAPDPQRLTPIIKPLPIKTGTDSQLPTQYTVPSQQQEASSEGVTTVISPTTSEQAVNESAQAISNGDAAAYGLAIARQKGQIVLSTSSRVKVHKAIQQLLEGKSIEQAAESVNLPVPVLKQLIVWGQQHY